MERTHLISYATGIVLPCLASVAQATPTTITIPGVPLPSGAPELPALALAGSGSLTFPTLPTSLPALPALPAPLPSLPQLPVPAGSLPTDGGSLSVSGGIGGPGYVIQPLTITIDSAALPALPSSGSGNSIMIPAIPLPSGAPAFPNTPIDETIPLPSGGSISVMGGIGGADLVQATTITFTGLPALP